MLLTALHSPAPARAQAERNAADSAATARRLFREANVAVRAGDTAAAHRKLGSATLIWPTQAAYLWSRAQLAAARNDTSDAVSALTQFAALGATRPLAGDRMLSGLAADPRLAPAAARLAANALPLVHSSVRLALPDSTTWPEGMDYDPRTRQFFIASVRNRAIYIASARGTRSLLTGEQPGIGAMLAVRVDPDGVHLWATTGGIPQMRGYVPADSGIAALLRIRIADGKIIDRWDLPPSAAGHTLGDIAIGPAGEVWFSDSQEPVLYRLRRGTRTLDSFTDVLFRSLQGVAPSPDRRHVYVADYSHGLLRLDLQTRAVVRLADAPSSTSLGVDGLVWYHNSLIGIQNGSAPARVVRFRLDASGTRIVSQEVIDRNTEVADEPTIGTIVGSSFVYVANSQWEKYDEKGVRVPGTTLTPPLLLALPLLR
jgi:hypothetical protein